MTLVFRCGHAGHVNPDKTPSPTCPTCGERQVARVLGAPPPRFTGWARGPLVQETPLEARAVRLAEKPMRLKVDDASQ